MVNQKIILIIIILCVFTGCKNQFNAQEVNVSTNQINQSFDNTTTESIGSEQDSAFATSNTAETTLNKYAEKYSEFEYNGNNADNPDLIYYNEKNIPNRWEVNDEFTFTYCATKIGIGYRGINICPFSQRISIEKANADMYDDSYRITEVFKEATVTHFILFNPEEEVIENPIFYIQTKDSALVTFRGVRVGDTVKKLIAMYPNLDEGDNFYSYPADTPPEGDHINFYTELGLIKAIEIVRVLP